MTSLADPAPKDQTVSGALRATAAIIWAEADAYTKRQLIYSFALLVFGSVIGALLPVIYKVLIDAFSGTPSQVAFLTPTSLIATYVACMYVGNTSGALRQLVHGLGTQRLNRRLSNRLFGHIIRLPLAFHLNRKTGAIGETLGQGLSGCQILLQHAVFTFLPVIVQFLAIVVVLVQLKHSAYLAIIAVSAVAYGFTFWRAAESISAPSRRASEHYINSHATLTDSLLNYETIKYFAGERLVCARYDAALCETERSWRDLLRLKVRNGVLLETIYALSLAVTLGYAAYQVQLGRISVGDFVLLNTYVGGLYAPLEAMGMAARDMSQGLAFLQRMLDVFRESVERDAAPACSAALDLRGDLTFENVSFSYKSDRIVLRDVSFSVPAGKTLAIVGISGSGKSSLIRLLFRLYEPNSGRILIDGHLISDLPLSRLREAIAVVPQDSMLFNESIGHNIAFGKPHARPLEVEHAARLAQLHELISRLPNGYATPVGERGFKLSGGERQRVAIARAALKNPRIFVFDEATSSLDSRSEGEIIRSLREVSRSCTTLVVAHRLSTVVHADEIVVLEHGVIVERGTHTTLLAKGAAYAALWRAQQVTRNASQIPDKTVVGVTP